MDADAGTIPAEAVKEVGWHCEGRGDCKLQEQAGNTSRGVLCNERELDVVD